MVVFVDELGGIVRTLFCSVHFCSACVSSIFCIFLVGPSAHPPLPLSGSRPGSVDDNNVDEHDRAGLAAGDSLVRRMRITCWIPKPTNTLLIAFFFSL
jgi:hypothetical protein